MESPSSPQRSDPAVLVLAPLARDTARLCEFLTTAGMAAQACERVEDLCECLPAGRVVVLTAEESLRETALSRLSAALAARAGTAVLVLVSPRQGSQPDSAAQRLYAAFDEVTLLTRPVHPLTLHSVVRTALHAGAHPHTVSGQFTQAESAAAYRGEESQADTQTLTWLRAVLAQASVVAFQQDRELRYVDIQGRLQALAHEQMAGKTDAQLWSAEDARALDAFKREIIATGSDARRNFHLHGPNRSYDVEIFAQPVRGPDGAVVGLRGVMQDIGEHVALRERLRRQADRLARIDQHKNAFIARLGQALRGPLAPIRNATHVLRVGGPTADAHVPWAVDAIERQVQTLSRLLDDLLDIARVTYSDVPLRMEPLELGQLISQAVEAVQPLVRAHGQSIAYTAPVEPLWIQGERIRVMQIVGNLLYNVARHAPPGDRITLMARRSGEHAMLSVADRGIGVPTGSLPYVFEPLRRPEREVNLIAAGLGLGLVLVKQLVALHGGSVEARSGGEDQDNSFIVRLPLRPMPVVERTTSPEVAAALRILVVDDDPDVAHSFQLLLRLMGHEVEAANDGASALAKAVAFRPQVAFIDIDLPDTDGYALSRALRTAQPQGLHLIAVTGYGPDDVGAGAPSGFEAVLPKPVTVDTLERLLAALTRA